MNHSNIYIGRAIKLDGINSQMNKSQLIILNGSSLEIGNIDNMSDSTIEINYSLAHHENNHSFVKIGSINNMKASTIMINSNANISNLNIQRGDKRSFVCINGELKVGSLNINDSKSKVYAKIYQGNHPQVIVGEDAFKEGGDCFKKTSLPGDDDNGNHHGGNALFNLPEIRKEFQYKAKNI